MPNPYARHGDLVIYDASIPTGAKRTSSKLLQRGNSDAADHTVAGGTLYRLEGDARVWIRVARGEARISHAARHTTGTLPRGEYVVVRLVQATDAGVMPVED